MNLSNSKELHSMKFKINDIKFECNCRLIREFKVTYNKAKEHSGRNIFSVPETKWNYVVEHYFEGTDNNFIIMEDIGDDVDVLSVPDYIYRVLISMFKHCPALINGKDTIFWLYPNSDREWYVATFVGIMNERDSCESISDFWRRISTDENILDSAKNLLFEIEL